MDTELIAYLQQMEQRLTAKIDGSVQAVEQRLTAKIDGSVQAVEQRLMAKIDGSVQAVEQRLMAKIEASESRTVALVVEVKESLEREIQDVSGKVDRMSARLDKIAAGAHYVTRLVEWSEKQDKFQEDFAQRLQNLETRVSKLEKPK